MGEAQRHAVDLQRLEFVGRPVAHHRVVVGAGLQVLADGDHVDIVRAQVAQGAFDLFHGFAEAEHDAALGRHVGMLGLELLQQGQRPLVIGARADVAVQIGHGFEVVVEHVRRVLRQDLQRPLHAALAAEVGGEDLDLRLRAVFAHRGDAVDEMLGAAVAQVVAVDAGHHHVFQAHVGDGAGQIQRLVGVRRLRTAVGDIAERTAAGADLTEDHEGCGAVAEALVDVGAAGFLADRDQAVLAQFGLEILHRVAGRNAHPDPGRLAQRRGIGELHRRARDLVAGHLLDSGLQRRRRIGSDDGERDALLGGCGLDGARRGHAGWPRPLRRQRRKVGTVRRERSGPAAARSAVADRTASPGCPAGPA